MRNCIISLDAVYTSIAASFSYIESSSRIGGDFLNTKSMSLYTTIIDRTLPEIYPNRAKISRLDILDFCWMLKSTGIGIIEITPEILSLIGKLPEGLEFIVRVKNVEDIVMSINCHAGRILLGKSLLGGEAAELIKTGGLDAVLELRVNSIDGICRLENLPAFRNFAAVSCIRILGLDAVASNEWLEEALKIRADIGKKIDICIGNKFQMGTSTTLEGVAGGVDFATVTLCGFGSFTPLEEMLAGIKTQFFSNPEYDPVRLSKLAGFISEHTRHKYILTNHLFSKALQ